MSKILKNTTTSPIFVADAGVTIPASGSYTIPPGDYLIWAASSNIVSLVGDGTIVVNDGSADLSISLGIDLLKGLYPRRIGITSGDDFTNIGHVGDRLKVNATIDDHQIIAPTYSGVFSFHDMNTTTGGVARGTAITSTTTFTTTYSYSGSGFLHAFGYTLEGQLTSASDSFQIRLQMDSVTYFVVDTRDVATSNLWGLNAASDVVPYGIVGLTSSGYLRASFMRNPIRFNSNCSLSIRKAVNTTSRLFRAGFVVITRSS